MTPNSLAFLSSRTRFSAPFPGIWAGLWLLLEQSPWRKVGALCLPRVVFRTLVSSRDAVSQNSLSKQWEAQVMWKGRTLVLQVTVPAELTFSQPNPGTRPDWNVPASCWKCIPPAPPTLALSQLHHPWLLQHAQWCPMHCRAGHAISPESCSNFWYSESASIVRCLLFYATVFWNVYYCYDCLHPPPQFVFGGGSFSREIGFDEVMGVGPPW